MRLVSFQAGRGASYGLLADDGIVDLGTRLGADCPTLRTALARHSTAALAEIGAGASPEHSSDAVTFLPVIPDPGKILCIGLNYQMNVAEGGHPDRGEPTVFTRVPESQVGHLQPMICPRESDRFDYEGEIAVVIGKPGRRIAEAEAWDHIAGYACYNEGSVRDWQRHTSQFTAGKNFMRTGAFGPWMVAAAEVADPKGMTLVTRLNGREMQRATVADMIFPIDKLIAYCSTFTTLQPGDVIVTGTPGGVGARRDPPVWLKHGDTVEVEVSGIGILRNPVVKES